jgi:hypothetical protein
MVFLLAEMFKIMSIAKLLQQLEVVVWLRLTLRDG